MALDLHAPVGDIARALVDVPSVSGDERALADEVEQALRGCPHLSVVRDGDAMIARTELGRAERVIIAGHLDTVPIADNVPGSVDGDTLWGRGTVDMKGGVAVQLAIAAALPEPRRDVTWVFYDHEEVEASKSGLGRLVRRHPALLAGDFAVLCEPTGGVVEGGCNGSIRVELTIPGVAAHSARSWKGENAIHAAGPVLATLATHQASVVTVDGLDYREGLLAVGIRGGVAGNVVPDECVVTVNYRYAPDKTADEALAVIRAVVADALPSGAALVVTDQADACRPGLDALLARELVKAVAETGAEQPRAKLGWTDVARFGALGIPAVNYGPGDPELAHTDDERVSIAEIEAVRKGLESWLRG